jgi:hypothetical protein
MLSRGGSVAQKLVMVVFRELFYMQSMALNNLIATQLTNTQLYTILHVDCSASALRTTAYTNYTRGIPFSSGIQDDGLCQTRDVGQGRPQDLDIG